MPPRKTVETSAEAPVLTRKDIARPNKKERVEGDAVLDKNGRKIGVLTHLPHLDNTILEIPVGWIIPNPNQPRQNKKLTEEEKKSIEDQIEPIVVIPFHHTKQRSVRFLIGGGELRYLRAQQQGKRTMLCRVTWESSLTEIFRKNLISDVARREYNPIEEAEAFRRRIEDMLEREGVINKAAAERALAMELDRNLLYVQERLRLLNLDKRIQQLIFNRRLPVTKAEEMTRSTLGTEQGQSRLGEKLAALAKTVPGGEKLPVREVDKIISEVRIEVSRLATTKPRRKGGPKPKPVRPRQSIPSSHTIANKPVSPAERKCNAVLATMERLIQQLDNLDTINTDGLRKITDSGKRKELYGKLVKFEDKLRELLHASGFARNLLEPPGGMSKKIQKKSDDSGYDRDLGVHDTSDPFIDDVSDFDSDGDPKELNFD